MTKKNANNYPEMPRLFQMGEEKAYDFFFRQYYSALCFFANRYLNDLPAAEDMVSEGFIQLWANREKIKNENHLKNWLYRAVYHLCLDQLEKNRTREKHTRILKQTTEKEEMDYSFAMMKAETLRQLKQAIDLLPGQCKKVFYKLYIEGKTIKQTAEELQLAIKTIDSQKTRGIKLLRNRIAPYLIIIPAAILLFLIY